jgi:hypothetical protein
MERSSTDDTTQLLVGDVVDDSTGRLIAHIGSWKRPLSFGGIHSTGIGFIEGYILPEAYQQKNVYVYGIPFSTINGGKQYTGSLPSFWNSSSNSCMNFTATDIP